eukprot:gnl/MRDRNA2_/MRDRNA2_123289_c0_seq1.p1 gnl/MRDRNA2_/MRDRNA2_123289_c0~~gnl/MRDRNA2_/MRDRNA2_123289_c0_seq1.p1  ORF type:complete len:919 (+),score=216.97 gnl/MRDRNA2_/MRDRNA2_123289_c0_seq1:121-2877(+)
MLGGSHVVNLRQTLELRLRSDVKSRAIRSSKNSGILVDEKDSAGSDSKFDAAGVAVDRSIVVATEDSESQPGLHKVFAFGDDERSPRDQDAIAVGEIGPTSGSLKPSLEQRWVDFWVQLQTHESVVGFEERLEEHALALADQHGLLDNLKSQVLELRGIYTSLQEQMAITGVVFVPEAAASEHDVESIAEQFSKELHNGSCSHLQERMAELETSFCTISHEFDRLDQDHNSRTAEISDLTTTYGSRFAVLEAALESLNQRYAHDDKKKKAMLLLANDDTVAMKMCWSAWQDFTRQEKREKDLQQFFLKHFENIDSQISDLSERMADRFAEIEKSCKKFASCRDLNVVATGVTDLRAHLQNEVHGKLTALQQNVKESMAEHAAGALMSMMMKNSADEDKALLQMVWLAWQKGVQHHRDEVTKAAEKDIFLRHVEDLVGDETSHLHIKFSALSAQIDERFSELEDLRSVREQLENTVATWVDHTQSSEERISSLEDHTQASDERISNLEDLRQPLGRVESVIGNWEACNEMLTESTRAMQARLVDFEARLLTVQQRENSETLRTDGLQQKLTHFEERLHRCEKTAASLPALAKNLNVDAELLQSVCGALAGELEKQVKIAVESQRTSFHQEMRQLIDAKVADVRKDFKLEKQVRLAVDSQRSSLHEEMRQVIDEKVADVRKSFASPEVKDRVDETMGGKVEQLQQESQQCYKSLAALEVQFQTVKGVDAKVINLEIETQRLSGLLTRLESSPTRMEFLEIERRAAEFVTEVRMMEEVRDQVLHRLEAGVERFSSQIAMHEEALVLLGPLMHGNGLKLLESVMQGGVQDFTPPALGDLSRVHPQQQRQVTTPTCSEGISPAGSQEALEELDVVQPLEELDRPPTRMLGMSRNSTKPSPRSKWPKRGSTMSNSSAASARSRQ